MAVILSGCLVYNNKKEILLLYRKDHGHYETPGGKIGAEDCKDIKNPTTAELSKTAVRELFEELGNELVFEDLTYFGKINFIIPGGRKGIAHKFATKVLNGKPRINEPEKFSKMDWLPIKELEKYPLSPDLILLISRLKKGFL